MEHTWNRDGGLEASQFSPHSASSSEPARGSRDPCCPEDQVQSAGIHAVSFFFSFCCCNCVHHRHYPCYDRQDSERYIIPLVFGGYVGWRSLALVRNAAFGILPGGGFLHLARAFVAINSAGHSFGVFCIAPQLPCCPVTTGARQSCCFARSHESRVISARRTMACKVARKRHPSSAGGCRVLHERNLPSDVVFTYERHEVRCLRDVTFEPKPFFVVPPQCSKSELLQQLPISSQIQCNV